MLPCGTTADFRSMSLSFNGFLLETITSHPQVHARNMRICPILRQHLHPIKPNRTVRRTADVRIAIIGHLPAAAAGGVDRPTDIHKITGVETRAGLNDANPAA